MSTIHSVAGSLVAAANIYGWRIDAILLGGLLWMVSATYHQVSPALVAPAGRQTR